MGWVNSSPILGGCNFPLGAPALRSSYRRQEEHEDYIWSADMEFFMQPIRRFTVVEEVNDMEPLPYPVAATVGGQLQQQAPALMVEVQICAADTVVTAGRQDSPRVSEQSIGEMNSRAPGWTRRVRIGAAAPGRTPCPSRVSALENAIRWKLAFIL